MHVARSRAATVLVVLVASAAAGTTVALGSDAAAPPAPALRAQPAIAVVSSPRVQTLEMNVVAVKGHARGARLLLPTARFTIRVTNPGSVALTGVRVDAGSRRCDRRIGALAPGASTSYTCSAPNVGRDYTNIVTATGRPVSVARSLTAAQTTATATATATAKTAVKVKKPKARRRAHTPHLAFTG